VFHMLFFSILCTLLFVLRFKKLGFGLGVI
jgi:hypothetical protein